MAKVNMGGGGQNFPPTSIKWVSAPQTMQSTERSTSVERKKFPGDFPDAFLSVSVQGSGEFSICLMNLRMIRYPFNKSLLITFIWYSHYYCCF